MPVELDGSIGVGCGHDHAPYLDLCSFPADANPIQRYFASCVDRIQVWFEPSGYLFDCILLPAVQSEGSISILSFIFLQQNMRDRFLLDYVLFKAFLHRVFIDHFCKNYIASSSVDGSMNPVATARTELCSIPVWLPEDYEFLLFASASILVCIASSVFAFPSMCASTLVKRALLSGRNADKEVRSVAREAVMTLLCQSIHFVFELLDDACSSFDWLCFGGLTVLTRGTFFVFACCSVGSVVVVPVPHLSSSDR